MKHLSGASKNQQLKKQLNKVFIDFYLTLVLKRGTIMNNRIIRTYTDIYTDPVKSNIEWSAIESLFVALGAKISEGNGSRVRVELNGARAVFHRPHPEKTTDKAAVKAVRRFLLLAEVRL
jgi:hypothetical protein